MGAPNSTSLNFTGFSLPNSSNQLVSGGLTLLFGVTLYIMLFSFTCAWVTSSTERFLDLALLNLGVACGWILGVYASPGTDAEAARFSRLSTVVSSFLTGFVLSKSDDFLKWLADPGHWSHAVAFRFVLCVSGVLIAALVAYALREYISESSAEPALSVDLPASGSSTLPVASSWTATTRLVVTFLRGSGTVTLGRAATETDAPASPTTLPVDVATPLVKQLGALGTGAFLVLRNPGTEAVSCLVEALP